MKYKKAVCAAAAIAAGITGQVNEARATNACPRSTLTDDVVIIPIVATDTPSSEVLSPSTLISEAQKVRDWFKESSFGCYVPDVWVAATVRVAAVEPDQVSHRLQHLRGIVQRRFADGRYLADHAIFRA